MQSLFRPLSTINKKIFIILCFIEACVAIYLWTEFKSELFPTPSAVAKALLTLITTKSFYDDLITSTSLTLHSMGIAIIVSLIIGYTYLIPAMKPVTISIVNFRFLPLSGLLFFVNVLSHSGHQLKVILLVTGIVPFFVTSIKEEIDSINIQEYELCETLRMNNWKAWLEVIVIGRLDYILLAMKQNFAIAWLMITMVEGLNRSEGGFGVYLNDSTKFRSLASVLALLLVLLMLGLLFDFLIGTVRKLLFPYVKLQTLK